MQVMKGMQGKGRGITGRKGKEGKIKKMKEKEAKDGIKKNEEKG